MAVVDEGDAGGLTVGLRLSIVARLMRFSQRRAALVYGAILATAGLMVLVGAAGCGGGAPTSPGAPPGPGTPSQGTSGLPTETPAFSFTTFDGESVSSEDLKGKPVILNFWAEYCPACSEFAPHLEEVYQKHRDDGLLVFGVGADGSEAGLTKKAEDLGITYALAASTETGQKFSVRAIPMTFFIGVDGETKSAVLGARTSEQLAAEVEKIL